MSWQCVIPTLWHWAMTLTLNFQGQILKMLYHRNRRADWHGTKGMWVDRMLHSHCDFELWPHPWPWPWIFRVDFWNSCISGMGPPRGQLWMEQYLISFKYWPMQYTIWADPNYIWGLAILANSLLFSVNNILVGLWLNCISSVEITLFLLADILLQRRALFQC